MLKYLKKLGFKLVIADSPQLLEEIQRLRFEVYVKKRRFITENLCLDNKESDKFDKYSIHLALIDNQGIIAGAVRLVADSPWGFPMEEHCPYPVLDKRDVLNRKKVVEISRLVINQNYKGGRLKNNGCLPNETIGLNRLTTNITSLINPLIFGLYFIAMEVSKGMGITHWIAAMEEELSQLVKRYGFVFEPMGEKIEYYGYVRPYIANVNEIEEKVQRLNSFIENSENRSSSPLNILYI